MNKAVEAVAVGLPCVLKGRFNAGMRNARAVSVNADNLNSERISLVKAGGENGEAAGSGHGWLVVVGCPRTAGGGVVRLGAGINRRHLLELLLTRQAMLPCQVGIAPLRNE